MDLHYSPIPASALRDTLFSSFSKLHLVWETGVCAHGDVHSLSHMSAGNRTQGALLRKDREEPSDCKLNELNMRHISDHMLKLFKVWFMHKTMNTVHQLATTSALDTKHYPLMWTFTLHLDLLNSHYSLEVVNVLMYSVLLSTTNHLSVHCN